MAESKKDGNYVNSLIAVSNVDGETPVRLWADPTTHRLLVDLPTGSGDVVGPASSTDNAVARFDGATGKLLQNSNVLISDTGAITVAGAFTLPIVDGTINQVLQTNGSGVVSWQSAGTGTVTSVGFTGGIISVATATTTPALTVAGTSGGVVYFSSASTWASSALLTANAIMIGGGAGVAPSTTTTGTGVLTALGVNVGSANAFVVNGGALGTPSSGTVTNLTGTASININGTVGATTPTTGVFTTATANSFIPNSATIPSNGMYLPAANTLGWGINSAAEMTLTASALSPAVSDGNALGTGTLMWSDLFLASGGVINFNNGNATITHSAGLLTSNVAFTVGTSLSITAGTIELGAASDTTLSRSSAGVLAVEGVVIPSISSTNTFTNKRITKRTGTVASSATPTINTDNVDFYSITAQTVDITSMTTNLSGTPTEGQTLWVAITGTAARAITWGSSFEASTVALPTTTVTTNRLDVGFVWNTVTSKWRIVATC